ncbi:hypothetical protein FACS1894201_10820 [Bacteroidia bacterium]|nr:hypothetical protein FACS1894201_10820 [Bacteroidia bacterium]
MSQFILLCGKRMKTYKFILLIFISVLFCSGSSCERQEYQYYITIKNNSDKEIICLGMICNPTISDRTSIAQDTMCLKRQGRAYRNFIRDKMIKPYSSKKDGADLTVKHLQTYPVLVWYIGVFNRIDIDTMSCEEFEQKYPLKQEWKVTLADMEACDWTLVYAP